MFIIKLTKVDPHKLFKRNWKTVLKVFTDMQDFNTEINRLMGKQLLYNNYFKKSIILIKPIIFQ